jgi:hypothetical protein
MRSIHLLGKDTADEWRLVELVGGPPHRFFQLAQRIAWGITQPDLIRVDLIDTAHRLVRSHGSAFPAHLFAAWVWRARDPDHAERHLENARRLATPGHPLSHLLPSEAEWRIQDPDAQALVEIVPGRIWRVVHGFPLVGAPLHSRSVATVIRTTTGDLAILNPVELGEPLAQTIAALGPVRWVISQGKSHSAFVGAVRRQFKGSLAIGTEGHLRHPPASHAMFDGVLGTSRLPDDFELLPIHGHLFEEVMILDRPSKTLIAQDVAAFGADRGPFVNRLYTFAFGLLDGVGFPSFSLMLWKMPALHASLTRVRDAEFVHVLGAHSAAAPRDGDAALLRTSIDQALGLSNLGHKAMLGRYFASQPSFLRDLVRYLKASKGKSGARLREATGSDA